MGHKGKCVSETKVFMEKRPDGAMARTCSGKCGDVSVGPIDCPEGSSPVLDCTANPPTLSCLANDAPSPFIDLDRLAGLLVGKIGKGALASSNKLRGVASITGDDCVDMTFNVGGSVYKFTKAGKDSWVETVKYSHRNSTNICVEDNGITNADRTIVPTQIYDA